jgi:hypothetical protein
MSAVSTSRNILSALPVISMVVSSMLGIILSKPVWSWINDDEEHDLVRFRQRLIFVIFWTVFLGLFQLRNPK